MCLTLKPKLLTTLLYSNSQAPHFQFPRLNGIYIYLMPNKEYVKFRINSLALMQPNQYQVKCRNIENSVVLMLKYGAVF